MNSEWLLTCLQVVAATSLAVIAVGLLRKPLRRMAGAKIGYRCWLIVPLATFAALIPAPPTLPAVHHAVRSGLSVAPRVLMTTPAIDAPALHQSAVLLLWLAGAIATLGWLLHRQRSFVRSLGPLEAGPDGTFRSRRTPAPILLGVLRPRIIVPCDFESRYSDHQRQVMLMHEHAHKEQHDPLINAVAAGWMCVFWFNPLVHWALARLYIDQELACDASVLRSSGISRRTYAEVLLETQLATESIRHVPVSCAWQSHHPLKERFAMLKHPLPGTVRRIGGNLTILALALTGTYAVWAAQPDRPQVAGEGTPITVHMKWLINGVNVATPNGIEAFEIRTTTGHEFVKAVSLVPGEVHQAACTASLPADNKSSVTWDAVKASAKASGKSIDNLILLECRLSSNGKVFSKPAVAVSDGKTGIIETMDAASHAEFRLELTASSATKT